MNFRFWSWSLALVSLCSISVASAQKATLLPRESLIGLANTVSGSRPLQVLTDFTGYNRDRQPDEYGETWLESRLFERKAREYGFSDVEILRYERNPLWDGAAGELWVISPILRKIVDFKDIPTALVPGSVSGTYEGEMIWIEDADHENAFEALDVAGKIVVTASSTRRAFRNAASRGALGVVNMNSQRPYLAPDAIVWSDIGRTSQGFAFNISAPMLRDLRQLARSEPLVLRAVVQAEWREADNEVITAVIPGDGSTDEWIYFSAHVFEGLHKQGAADDGSGAVLILEAGRTILEAMEKGHIGRPARSMRFLWVDEFRGTFDYLNSHPEELEKLTADINIDMAGQNTTRNANSTRLYRMPDSRIHFIADVAQEFFEWVGATNMEHVHERGAGYGFLFPILDPYGTRDPFRYWIEPFYGSSDHQVYNDRGVPAILFNHWPDMVYHSSHDRPDQMDSTQMKRVAFIAAATGLVAAGVPEADPLKVAGVAYQRGQARISNDIREWSHHLLSLPGGEMSSFYKDIRSAVPQWYGREDRNLDSVRQLSRGSSTVPVEVLQKTIESLQKNLASEQSLHEQSLRTVYQAAAVSRGLPFVELEATPEETAALRLVPVKLQTRIRQRGGGLPGFAAMETVNFIDGKRSVVEIRDAVNSEYGLVYGSIALETVLKYLRSLERSGSIQIDER